MTVVDVSDAEDLAVVAGGAGVERSAGVAGVAVGAGVGSSAGVAAQPVQEMWVDSQVDYTLTASQEERQIDAGGLVAPVVVNASPAARKPWPMITTVPVLSMTQFLALEESRKRMRDNDEPEQFRPRPRENDPEDTHPAPFSSEPLLPIRM